MPIFEYNCLQCGKKVEQYVVGAIEARLPLCAECGKQMERVEFSVPAKRNPEKGIQK